MLESLLNKVAGPYDCCETYLLHALLRFYFFDKTLQSYVHRSIFRTESNIYDGAFFTSVKPYILKMYFIRSNFPSENFHELSQEGLYKVVLKIKILHVPVN